MDWVEHQRSYWSCVAQDEPLIFIRESGGLWMQTTISNLHTCSADIECRK